MASVSTFLNLTASAARGVGIHYLPVASGFCIRPWIEKKGLHDSWTGDYQWLHAALYPFLKDSLGPPWKKNNLVIVNFQLNLNLKNIISKFSIEFKSKNILPGLRGQCNLLRAFHDPGVDHNKIWQILTLH